MKKKQFIYVVDDNVDYLNLVQYVFTHYLPQYSVAFFFSGESLLANLQASDEPPVLILLDLHMPGISGQQTLEQLKERPGWKPIPVVMVTSATSESEIQACYEAGANSCLVKPRTLEAIRKLYQEVCAYWVDMNGPATF